MLTRMVLCEGRHVCFVRTEVAVLAGEANQAFGRGDGWDRTGARGVPFRRKGHDKRSVPTARILLSLWEIISR